MRALWGRVPAAETAIVVVAGAILVIFSVLAQQRKAANAPKFDSYSSFDAASGGYRAWYELLAREGLRVDRFERRPAFLDHSIDTLVYAEPLPFAALPSGSTPADARALEAWVRTGGRLLYLGHDDAAAKLGILKLPASFRAPIARAAQTRTAFTAVRDVAAQTDLRWKPRRNVALLVRDRAGALVVRYRFGSGQVVAAIDQRWFSNAGIAHGDGARLAYLLARPSAVHGLVAFDEAAHGYLAPEHWWSIVPRSFLIALAIVAAACLIAFTGAAVRLGPPIVPEERRDATSAEFIESLAALFERGGAAQKATSDAARSTTRVIALSLGLDERTPTAAIAARLEGADRAAFLEMTAVAASGPANDKTLVRAVALAQSLRKEFTTHARQRH